MQLFRRLGCLFIACISGCATYHPQPLTKAQLAKSLQAVETKALENQASLLQHPRIPPENLDFSKALTPRKLALLAVLVSPELQALRMKNKVANAQIFDTGLLPDPQFSGGFALPLESGPGFTNAYSYGFSWDVGAIVTTQTKLKIVTAQTKQIRYDVVWQEWAIFNQAELYASQIYFLKKQVMLADKATQSALSVLNVTKGNMRKHNATADEFGLRQTTYLDFLNQKISLQKVLKKTQLQLNQLIGISPEYKVPLAFKPLKTPSIKSPKKLFAEACRFRLDLLALQAGYQSQEATVYQAILGQFPHLTMGLSKARDNTNVHSAGGVLNFDIPIINRNRGAIAVARATRDQLYQEYLARLNQVRSDIAILIADLQYTNQEIAILEQQLPQMRKTEQYMHLGVMNGNVTLINYQTVLTSLLTNELRLLALKQNRVEQLIAVRIATGRYDPKDK